MTDPRTLPEDARIIIPLRDAVLFPGVLSPVTVHRQSSVAAAQEAVKNERPLGFLLQRDPQKNDVGPDDLYWVGTEGPVARYITGQEGAHHLLVQGQARFRVLEFLEGWPFLVARVALVDTPAASDSQTEARFLQLKQQTIDAIALLPNVPDELADVVRGIESPALLADMVTNLIDIKAGQKQDILETFDLARRLDKVIELLAARLEVLRLSKEIGERTRAQFDERQRETVLREQLRQIQKELGETDDGAAEAAQLKETIEQAGMPEEVLNHARKELSRLQRMGDGSGEYAMLRTYLEWLTELPWKHEPQQAIDLAEARRVLDEDHFGLDKIKRRILEYLAVRKLNPEGRSPILCFVGPPGVGKTSLGQSIARATGRAFQRVALGGVHDEAEIRGHRRTYLGALPGNIIQAVRRAGTGNLVLMLDEIDKLGAGGFHGDPGSALLEVLDPEQNHKFRDNYLAVDYDLSHVMFICTANVLDTVPGPLRDRMEIIDLPGYTEEEKIQIARRYLIKRQLEANGLRPEQADITDAALAAIVGDYTREAGVRNLEREIGSVLRHAAMQVAEGKAGHVSIDAADLGATLGPRRFENEVALRTSLPGVATGLAWTPVGGDILFIEASKVPGSGRLILTGQLGDVMKESAQAALTLAKTWSGDALEKVDIHIHVPAGATPKDGPSAGVAMFVALASLLSGRPVDANVAMTGEVSLRGLVLPIGGIKEKTLAALRAGITTVMLPRRNEKDLDDVPAEARRKLRFVLLDRVEDALRCALGDEPQAEDEPAARATG
ncbi:endopeptidase La [Bordetella bronchiseptica]|uniref:Lon protease n=3 Tax=Bordetella bronchiseptica TaxID=518 RepID=A0A0H3LPC1_BORBR|nr:endopeptidase La [Bordetella bronchiseptica]KAK66238.1 endopeptidase La [Bordetella bronchiseptica 980-2]SHR54785.1 ATP-dependent protease La [Mycobacteroides abscessus subsp. abscessus]AMG87699.1 endopeptidase La [Bordetella bronchiseptica]AWP74074.1 endopeptidase La [Bordetella bronchiseptica]AWP78897.1 endopeptidase La [Bordetella bronchiseptica]